MRPEQPRKPLGESYNRLEFLRETEAIHKRVNNLIISPAIADLIATKADYAAGDVGSAADIAAALNTLAAAINGNVIVINALIEKLNLTSS